MVLAGTDRPQRAFSGSEEQNAEEGYQAPSPVFILSPAPRSGSDFLAQILQIHPPFQQPTLLSEDYALVYSQLLEQYVNQTAMRWPKDIRDNEEYRRNLLRHLGEGILSFLYEHIERDRRLLCKTPRAHNIDKFFLLFPEAKLFVLIRDGRDVVESAARTWPNRIFAFARSTRTWAQGARYVLDFMHGPYSDMRERSWELVTYESLVDLPQVALRDIFGFLDIDADTFDMAQVERLPLRGSSVHRGGKGEVHWVPVERPKDFRPIGRWKSWDFIRKMTFKIIAGRELVRLGFADNNHW